MLRVSNLDESIKYYEQCLGMKLIRKRENPGADDPTLSAAAASFSFMRLWSLLPPIMLHFAVRSTFFFAVPCHASLIS
jgi:catechol 2,3-dioxygenase-like lactoylglutathione lyase family enzyme